MILVVLIFIYLYGHFNSILTGMIADYMSDGR